MMCGCPMDNIEYFPIWLKTWIPAAAVRNGAIRARIRDGGCNKEKSLQAQYSRCGVLVIIMFDVPMFMSENGTSSSVSKWSNKCQNTVWHAMEMIAA
mmetsp:Transcript_27109/g.44057  ORF Transcript_27109/g.44057 Transcript_27109/m.44057 type:complete len:97 (+) Transcript_27109:1052-1342(+)